VKELAKVTVEVFGSDPPCAKCKATYKLAKELASGLGGDVDVTEKSALSKDADKYGIMLTPTVVVNGKVMAVGKIPQKEELLAAIKSELAR
jgi:predicted thioredoxin/glutaredoxin